MADTSNLNFALLPLSGWIEEDIDDLVHLRIRNDLQLDGKINFALLFLVIKKIEDSLGLDIKHTLPEILEVLGLKVPENLSSFVRSVRRCILRAEKQQTFDEVTNVPDCFLDNAFIAPKLKSAGVSVDWLIHESDNLQEPLELTYDMILELANIRMHHNCTYYDISQWIQRLRCMDDQPVAGTVEWRIKQIIKEKSRLRGNKQLQMEFLQTVYSYTSRITCTSPCDKAKEYSLPSSAFPTLAQLAGESLRKSFHVTVDTKIPVVHQLDRQLSTKTNELKSLESKLQESQEKLNVLTEKSGRYDMKNVYRRDVRYKKTKAKMRQAMVEISNLKSTITELTQAKDNALKLKSQWMCKAKKRKSLDCEECVAKHRKINKMNDKIEQLDWDRTKLMCVVEDFQERENQHNSESNSESVQRNIITKEGKQYGGNVRAVWMELLSLGVAVGKVSKVVRAVIEGMTDMTVGNLPSKGLTSQLQTESQIIGQHHMADLISQSENVTIHLDGTKKRFREYGSFQVSMASDEGPQGICLGVEEMTTGKAKTYLDSLLSLFNDIAETFTENRTNIPQVAAKLIAAIKNTMTDRHVVNHKFKTLFEEARLSLFSDNLENFSTLDDDEKKKLTELHSLYCGLHVLTNLGTVAAKSLKVFEEIALATGASITKYSFNKGNARSFDLVFEVSQAMTRTGNQRSGCASNWEDYLAERGEKNHIESFLHHRFNVLFTDGGAIFYHKDQLVDFLSGYNLNENRLLLCIQESLVSPVCRASLRALGLIARLITIPLWILLEKEKNVHILHLNPMWLHLQTSLRELSVDATPLLQGRSVFPDVELKHNKAVWDTVLMESEDVDSLTKDCLEILLFDMEKLVSRQLQDQLPGGIYHSPSDQVLNETASCPTTNRIGERDFSDVDREVCRAPQKSTAHHSSSLTFRNNKTGMYLKNMSTEKRKKLIKRAIVMAPARRAKNRQRIQQIRRERQKLMRENKERCEEKKRRAAASQQELTSRVTELWKSEENMETVLCGRKKSEQIRAVKDQISLHALVSHPTCEKPFLKFSNQGVQKTLEELKSNLMIVLGSLSTSSPTPTLSSTTVRDEAERQPMIEKHKSAPIQSSKKLPSAPKPKSCAVTRAKKLVKKAQLSTCRKPKSIPTTCTTFTFRKEMVNHFLFLGYEDTWYLGEIMSIQSPVEALIKYFDQVSSKVFRWPVKDDKKSTKSCFVVSDLLTVSPRDSGLRFWELDDSKKQLNLICDRYSSLKKLMKWR